MRGILPALPPIGPGRTIPVMLSRLSSVAFIGIEATACEVEVDVAPRGFEKISIVGLP